MIASIIGIIIWLVVIILCFSKPKENYIPNWLTGIIGIGIILGYLTKILEKL